MQEIFGEFDSDNDELLDEKGGEEDAEWSALCDAACCDPALMAEIKAGRITRTSNALHKSKSKSNSKVEFPKSKRPEMGNSNSNSSSSSKAGSSTVGSASA